MKAKFETDKTRQYYFGTNDIAELIGCGRSTATLYARRWNKELAQKGYTIIAGKVPQNYVFERLGLVKKEA